MWFYPISTKSQVSSIFPQFKMLVEKRFQSTINALYSDNGGEFLGLKTYLSNHGISHYTTAPYTPQQNGVTERHHRHLVETGLTLLHNASLSLFYWPHAFQTAAYLINRQPTPLLQNQSPFEVLFRQQPNYLKLQKFGCLCYPLTKPYNTHKLQPKPIPCVFIGYSPTQNAYKCIDPLSSRIYLSKHVLFDKTQCPVSKTNPPDQLSSTRPPNHTHLFLKPNSCPVIPSLAPLVLASSSPTSTPPLEPSTSLDTVAASSASSPGITPSLSPYF